MKQAWEVIAEDTDISWAPGKPREQVSAIVITDDLQSAVEGFLRMYPSLKSVVAVQRLSGLTDGVIAFDGNGVAGFVT